MRIVSLNQDRGIRPGGRKGAAVHLACLREALDAEGHEVFAVDEPDAAAAAARLEELHRDAPVEFVVERYALGASSGAEFARRTGVPLVLEVNSPLMEEAARHRDWQPGADDVRLETDTYAAATRIVCVSEAVAESVRARGLAPERVVVRPNAVDVTRFRANVRRGDGPLVLGFHGRLRPWHGFERLVRIVSLLLRRGVDVRLHCVGEGPFAEAVALLPPERVTLDGWQTHERVAEIVAGFDVVVLTYDPDAPCYFSPLKLLESMAAGAVPVVPELGDLTQVVTHGVDGCVYPARDPGLAVEAVARLAADPDERVRLAEAAVARASRSSWTAIAREIAGWALPARVAGDEGRP